MQRNLHTVLLTEEAYSVRREYGNTLAAHLLLYEGYRTEDQSKRQTATSNAIRDSL